MGTDYVEHRDGNIYVGPSRVTIDTVITYWSKGQTPEQIHESFPSVPLAYIYGTIAYYLEHQEAVDAWLRKGQELWKRGWEETRKTHAEWFARNRERLEAIGVNLESEAAAESPDTEQPKPGEAVTPEPQAT